jgi:hypothetical protein
VKDRQDVYFLPGPDEVVVLSMGYRAALADVLWAHVMVSQGLHTFERRRFDNLLLLYDAINALDPTWRTPYLFAEAFVTFQSNETPLEEVRKVREILERGVKARPHDAEMWLALGQFVAYVAPSAYLHEVPEVKVRWRREGSAYLARAVELCGADSNICWQAMGGASILERGGHHHQSVRFLEMMYAVTDDEELKSDILARLGRLAKAHDLSWAAQRRDALEARERDFEKLVRDDLPFVNRDEALILGPPPRPGRCAGSGHQDELDCATTWERWGEIHTTSRSVASPTEAQPSEAQPD